MNEVAELLEWDTRFFGLRVARVAGATLVDETARQVDDWCRRERIDCLYFLADADSEETVRTAEKFGFGLKDVRVTYQRRLDRSLADEAAELPSGVNIRNSRPGDTSALETIAEGGFTASRFYFDRQFARPRVDEMYRIWVRQSLAGEADVVLVLEHGGKPCGFITCHLLDERTGQCGLGGIDAELRGQGLGQQLYEAALRWFAGRGVESVVYVTQARNIRAQRLYQRIGFLPQSVQFWYHKWFEHVAASSDVNAAA